MEPKHLWKLYQKHRSLRKVAQIVGSSHETIRRILVNAKYDLGTVNPAARPHALEPKSFIEARIKTQNADWVKAQPEGIAHTLDRAIEALQKLDTNTLKRG